MTRLKFGQVYIKLIHKKSLTDLPTKDFIISNGYLTVATLRLHYRKINVIDDNIKNTIITVLAEYVIANIKAYIPLASAIAKTGHTRCKSTDY